MPQNPLSLLLNNLWSLGPTQAGNGRSDRELLAQFATQQDEGAFALVVRRHGPMVLRVCRRVLHHEQDAEDAFQATFLVLARKARSVNWQLSAANWLHKTAYHVALRVKAAAARRRVHESQRQERVNEDPLDDLTARELLGVLDQELTGLPERYRAPLILCHMEGISRDEAARQLGCPLGTLKSRLERGRELLRHRLIRRGISLAAALAAAELGEGVAPAIVAPSIIAATRRAALAFANGSTSSPLLTPRVLDLANGALQSSAFASWKIALPLVLLLVSLTTGAGLVFRGHSNTPPAFTAGEREPPAETELPDRFGERRPVGAVARFGRPHVPGILLTALSAEYKFASWNRDGMLWYKDASPVAWDAHSVIGRWSLPDAHLFALALLPGGKSLAVVGGPSGKIYLWDFASGEKAPPVGERNGGRQRVGGAEADLFRCFAVSADGKFLAGGKPRSGLHSPKVVLWEAAAGKELHQLNPIRELAGQEQGVYWLAFSANGKLLVSADDDDRFAVWDIATGRQLSRFKGSPLPPRAGYQAIALTPDGKTVAQTLPDHTIAMWNTLQGKLRHHLRGDRHEARALTFSADGTKLISAGGGKRILTWDVATGRQISERRDWGYEQGEQIETIALAADGFGLVWGCENDHTVIDYGRPGPNGSWIHGHNCSWDQHLFPPLHLAPDGRMVASVAVDNMVRLWDVRSGKLLREISDVPVFHGGVEFSSDGRFIAGWSREKGLWVWQTSTGKILHRLPGGHGGVRSAFAPNGKTFVTCSDLGFQTRDAVTGRELRRMAYPDGQPACPVFSPDGRFSVMWNFPDGRGEHGRLYLLDANTDRTLRQFRLPAMTYVVGDSLAFSPDSKFLAIVYYDKAHPSPAKHWLESDHPKALLWEVGGGKDPRTLSFENKGMGQAVHAGTASFSPDFRTLALANGPNNTLVLYEMATGRIRRRLQGHSDGITGLAFDPGGREIVSVSYDNTALVWDLTNRKLRSSLPPNASMDSHWADLAGEDAQKAYQAIWALATAPTQAISLLEKKLKPVRPIDRLQVQRLIADLDSDLFATRNEAFHQLEKLHELAEPALRDTLSKQPSLEVRRVVEKLLQTPFEEALRPEDLQGLRGVEALEQIGSPEAQRLLKTLANGAPGARLTREAQTSLDRLAQRSAFRNSVPEKTR